MQYKFLGGTGLKVSELCLGAMTFGESTWGMETEQSDEKVFAMLNRFVEKGGNFIDTADTYGGGNSEKVIGRWLASSGVDRDSLVIATKVFSVVRKSGPNDQGLSRKHIMESVNASLERLQTSYIDLYQVHCWDEGTPLKETLIALNDCIRDGKVRYIGCSNYTGWQLQKSLLVCKEYGLEHCFVCIQPQYNLLCRSIEWEILPVCKDSNIGVIPWSPLKGGWLSGRYKRGDKQPESGRISWAQKAGWGETNFDNFNNDFTWALLDVIQEIAKETNRTAAQVSLRWVMQRETITCPIIGARTMEQLDANIAACEFELSEEQMNRLNESSNTGLPYPYNVVSFLNRNRKRE